METDVRTFWPKYITLSEKETFRLQAQTSVSRETKELAELLQVSVWLLCCCSFEMYYCWFRLSHLQA